MPFRSEKQRRYLWAKHPEIARKWADKYKTNKDLPMYVNSEKRKPAEPEKRALEKLYTIPLTALKNMGKTVQNRPFAGVFAKASGSSTQKVELPASEKPMAAGETEAKMHTLPETRDGDETAAKSLMGKIAAVISPKILKEIEERKALEEARKAQYIPQNVNLRSYPVNSGPQIPPPMGMTPPPQQPAQPQPQQQAQNTMAPVGGGSSPMANPINSFGALSMDGNINGNAAFGAKNSPDSSKIAAAITKWAASPVIDNFDVNTLVRSLKKLPELVHAAEPGFAATYKDPQLKNLLWRSSAVLPVGLAAAGLMAVGPNTPKPLSGSHATKKKKKISGSNTKTADLKTTLFNARAQLPGLHPVDTALGAVGGAVLGGLYDTIRGNSTRLPNNKRWKNTARRMLMGAALGGFGANVVGDRGRRYISNTLIPFGYDNNRLKNVVITPKQLIADIGTRFKNWSANQSTKTPNDSVSKLWNAAILDRPHYDLKDLEEVSSWGNYGGTIDSRREIMRRSFGVHANNPQTDWWQKNKGGYYSLNEKSPEYLQRLRLIFGPEKPTGAEYLLSGFLRDPQKRLTEFNTKLPQRSSQAHAFDLFAGGQVNGDQQIPFALYPHPHGTKIDAQVLDRFDLTPGEDEKKHLKTWVANKLTKRDPRWLTRRPGENDGHFHYKTDNKTNDELGKTIGARWLWENVLSSELPWISQKLTLTPNAPDKNQTNKTEQLPWSMQFLKEDGSAAGAPVGSTLQVREWLQNNPLAREHELLAILREAAKAQASTEKKSTDTQVQDVLSGAGRGSLLGMTAGGIYGLLAPGEENEYDEYGRVIGQQPRSRIRAAIRGALSGGVFGGAAGATLNYVQPGGVRNLYNTVRRAITGKTQNQLNFADNVRRMTPAQRDMHDLIMSSPQRLKNNPSPPRRGAVEPPTAFTFPQEPWETGKQMTDADVVASEADLY